MIRVVVAEDMHPLLRDLCAKIEAHSPEVSVVGRASNGRDACALVRTLHPDIVFTDIRMPMMDGLEAIHELESTGREGPLYVIISGYDEFEYARRAINLGVKDYLLKPVTQGAIDEVLERTIPLVRSRRAEEERLLVGQALRGFPVKAPGPELPGAPPSPTPSAPDHPWYIPFLLCAGSFRASGEDGPEAVDTYWLRNDPAEFFLPRCPSRAALWVFDGHELNEQIVVLGSTEELPDPAQVASAVLSALEQAEGSRGGGDHPGEGRAIPVTIVAGPPARGLPSLRGAYLRARGRLEEGGLFGRSLALDCSVASGPEAESPRAPWDDHTLAALLRTRREAWVAEIARIFHAWESQVCARRALEEGLLDLLISCLPALAEDKEKVRAEVQAMIAGTSTYSALQAAFLQAIDEEVLEDGGSTTSTPLSRATMERIDRLIQAKLGENLCVCDIARAANMSVPHFSREFKRYKGISPLRYMTTLKIEQAKELLRSPAGLLAKDVSELLGYTNPFYFSRVFKLVTGLSPSEYKASVGLPEV